MQRNPKMLDTIRKMEALWKELADGNEQYLSPVWHRDELSRTEDDLCTGKARFVAWNKAKIRRSLQKG